MARNFKGLHGIKIFAYDLIHIISTGATETITKVEQEMDNLNITNYIFNKYPDRVSMAYDDTCIYDLEAWNSKLADFSNYISGRESRKLGINNENDGLLLIVAGILDELKEPLE